MTDWTIIMMIREEASDEESKSFNQLCARMKHSMGLGSSGKGKL
jgi:hypothetical protein